MANGTQIGDLLFTADGGYATRMVAGEALSAGEVVYMGAADGKVIKNPINGTAPLGVVFEDAVNNADVWVVTSGIAKILPEAGFTATRGYFCYSSDATAGRVDQSSTPPNNRVGTWIANGTGNGVMTKAVLQCFGQPSSLSTFTWSTSEQVWPFEKTVNGDTLYCKQINMGTFNPSSLSQPHGISSYDVEKMYKIEGWAGNNNYLGTMQVGFQLSWATTVAASAIQLQVLDADVTLQTGQDLTGTDAYVRLWYWK